MHFAVSNREVPMVTRLDGPATTFLPFNQGNDGAAGNPVNPAGGHRTAYLWEQVWARESWLEILGRYLIAQRDAKKQLARRDLPALSPARRDAQAAGGGARGGRGREVSRAALGRLGQDELASRGRRTFSPSCTTREHRKVFDTVLVVSDRTVIDSQLQEALFDFQRHDRRGGDDQGQRGQQERGAGGGAGRAKKIVVCTIQTFPFALDAVRKLAATQGKRFAVIADEAHSSQTGEAASKLKAVLSPEELKELADGGEVSTEDILAAQMAARADDGGITFVAFTATPKNKTLELFGTRPTRRASRRRTICPRRSTSIPCGRRSRRGSSSTCSRTTRATSWPSNWRTRGRTTTRRWWSGAEAMKGIMGWVRLHPYNIAQKVQIVVEHFRQYVRAAAGRAGQGDGGGGEPGGGGALETGDRKIHRGARLQDGHAGGVLRRGERPGIRRRTVSPRTARC